MNMQELKALYAPGDTGKEKSYRINMDIDPPCMDEWEGAYVRRTCIIPEVFMQAIAILKAAGIGNVVLGVGVWEDTNQFGLFNAKVIYPNV